MRVGILALQHESNTFIEPATTLEDFRRVALVTGNAVRDMYAASHHELAGFFAGLEQEQLTPVPLLATQAVPSGTIEAAVVDELMVMLREQLAGAGKLDGLLVAPHGAGVSQNERDLDGYWLAEVRSIAGPRVPIVCTIDPHANVSRQMIEACDATIAYRTNPHLDQKETGLQAARLLARTLRGEVTPRQAIAMPRLAISIDRQATSEPPCSGLYAQADAMLDRPEVLSNSVVLGFPYADVAEMGSSFIVVTDGNAELAQAFADQLAQHVLDRRQEFACSLPSVEEALQQQAAGSSERVCLLDVGDNIGGGSPGDGTVLARALHEREVPGCFVCLYDPVASQAARQSGIGATLSLSMGGRGDPRQGGPFEANVSVASLHEGKFIEPQPRHGGRVLYDMGPTAVVRTEYGMTLMLTSERVPPFSLEQVRCCDLEPAAFHILIAKGVNAPIAAYREVCQQMIRVNTPGVTCADMTQLDFQHRRRPMFPFER